MSGRRRRPAAKRHPRGAGRPAAGAAVRGADRAGDGGRQRQRSQPRFTRRRRAGRRPAGARATGRCRAPAAGPAAGRVGAPAVEADSPQVQPRRRRRPKTGRSSVSTCAATPTWTRSFARWCAGSRTRATGWRSCSGELRFRLGARPAGAGGQCMHGRRRHAGDGAPRRDVERGAVTERHVRDAAAKRARAGAGAAGGADADGARPRAQPGSRDREGAAMLRATVTGFVWATKRIENIPSGAFLEVEIEGGGAAGRLRRARQRRRRARARRHRVGRLGLVRRRPSADRRADHRIHRRARQPPLRPPAQALRPTGRGTNRGGTDGTERNRDDRDQGLRGRAGRPPTPWSRPRT